MEVRFHATFTSPASRHGRSIPCKPMVADIEQEAGWTPEPERTPDSDCTPEPDWAPQPDFNRCETRKSLAVQGVEPR